MKLYILEILLSHHEYIAGVCHEYIPASLVLGHVLGFAFFEIFKLLLIIAFYPTCLVQIDRFPFALCAILM
jgi:hypothetical protein